MEMMRKGQRGFTLIELICVIAIVGLLAALILPAMKTMTARAERVSCAANLEQIGLTMSQKIIDNNGAYPKVESDPTDPVYPPDPHVETLAEALRPYGVTDRSLRCAADVRTVNNFAKKGTSYEWLPIIDGELTISPRIYLPSGVLSLPLSQLPVAVDFDKVHLGLVNVLFADGHVRAW